MVHEAAAGEKTGPTRTRLPTPDRRIRFLSRFNVLSFPEPAIIRYEQLRASHRQIGKNDLRIAAIVLERAAIVVTRNVSDFGQIPGLEVEDWTK